MGQYKRKLKKGNRWFYSGQFLTRKYHSKAIYHTKKECARAERDRLKELDEEARNPKEDISLLELFSHRLDYLKLARNQEYYRDNHRLLKQTLKKWGNINASQVTKKMVVDLIMLEAKRCQQEKLGNSRPNQLLKILKASFSYANKVLGHDIINPCLGLEKLPEESRVKIIPSEEMITAVKAKCNQAQIELIDFVYETGARINEAISLAYDDIKNDSVVLYTRKAKNSNRVPRIVPCPEFLNSEGEGRVFATWTAYPRFLEGKIRSLKQPTWNWHSLRHRRASLWAKEGKPLFELQMLLGHTQISTTQKYLHSLGIVKF